MYWALLLVTLRFVFIAGEEHFSHFHRKIQIPETVGEFLANASMIYPSSNPVDYSVRLAPPTWALTIEFFYYLFIGLGLSRTKFVTTTWFAASVTYLLYNMLSGRLSLGYGNIISASLPFSIGAMIYWHKAFIFHLIQSITSQYRWLFITLFTLNVYLIGISGFIFPDQQWKLNLVATYLNYPLSACVIVILLNEGKTFLPKKIDVFLGDLSYPVYIFHFSSAALISWLLFDGGKGGLSWTGAGIFIASVLITFFISVLINSIIHSRVEKIRELTKKRLLS